MPDQIFVGNFSKGLTNNRLAFYIDNDAFPTLINAMIWRGRLFRKRGTSLLGRLQIQAQSASVPSSWQFGSLPLVAGEANLITDFNLGSTACIVPGSLNVTVGANTYTDPAEDGNLTVTTFTGTITNATQANPCVLDCVNDLQAGGSKQIKISGVIGMVQLNGNTYTITSFTPTQITIAVDSSAFGAYGGGGTGVITGLNLSSATGNINYATGAISFSGGGVGPLTGFFDYQPGLPVMGIRELVLSNYTFPNTMFFDTKKAYQFNEGSDKFYNVSFYRSTQNPVTWSGQNYQQFWNANYQDAFWVTNDRPGFSYYSLTSITWVSATQLTLVITAVAGSKPIAVNDKVFTYQISTNATVDIADKLASVNGLTGNVSAVVEAPAGTFTLTVDFPGASIIDPTTGEPAPPPTVVYNSGIIQLLTRNLSNQDGIKYYNGDPTTIGIPDPAKAANFGWVNFAPPLSASGTTTSINDSPLKQWYLVGAKLIMPYKDRLLFFAPWIQATDGAAAIQLPDTCVFSWNGTAYYANLVPTNQSYDPTAYFVDQTGKGGWRAAGIQQEIVTANNNEDVLIVSFTNRQTRFVYTGNDISPFIFYSINAELGTTSTFSTVSLDQGCLSIGNYGLSMTDQQSTQRVDLQIPDQIFQITGANQGDLRVNSQRDFLREWVYFAYPVTGSIPFPTQTLLFNYRDNTYAILKENFTAHGQYRRTSSFNWIKAGQIFKTWSQWNQPWNASNYVADYASVVAGNPEGYVLIKDQGTGEGVSGYVQAITNSTNFCAITSSNHCLAVGDFVRFQNGIGTGLSFINNVIGKVIAVTSANIFKVDIPFDTFTYIGGMEFAKLSQPFVQSKQFPSYWQMGKKTRIGVQKYLLDTTARGEVTLNMYTSQNDVNDWNDGPGSANANPSVIYSKILYTCPESTNLGLTPANVNLQMPTAKEQDQIWHRFNTSLIGDTVQIGITLSDDQMKDYELATSEVALHAFMIEVSPSQHLA